MKRIKYFFVIFIGTLVYVVLSVTIGQNSIRCIKKMEEQKLMISKQTSDIQKLHSELELELKAFQNDKAIMMAYAHKLDYVREDEKLIKITGLKPAQTTLYDTGTVLRHEEPDFLSEKYCKIIALCLSMGVLFIFILYDINNNNISLTKEKHSIIAGIPVYDLPQL